jgi:cellulose biosynthesis protein BcsQ
VGKTTISVRLARGLADRGLRTLAVDCDPNPNLAESFGLRSASLERFAHEEGLRRAGQTLELAREPTLVTVTERIWMLGGPPSETPLADAVARGIAGVLLAGRFDAVVTDLGAGPEFTRAAVGGALNPADVCVVLTDGAPVAALTADRIETACRARGVRPLRAVNRRGEAGLVAAELLSTLLG